MVAYKVSSIVMLLSGLGIPLIILVSHFRGELRLFYFRFTILQAIINHFTLVLVKCCEIEIGSFLAFFLADDCIKTLGFKIQ